MFQVWSPSTKEVSSNNLWSMRGHVPSQRRSRNRDGEIKKGRIFLVIPVTSCCVVTSWKSTCRCLCCWCWDDFYLLQNAWQGQFLQWSSYHNHITFTYEAWLCPWEKPEGCECPWRSVEVWFCLCGQLVPASSASSASKGGHTRYFLLRVFLAYLKNCSSGLPGIS